MNGRDIRKIGFAVVEEGGFRDLEVVDCGPSAYLKQLDAYLKRRSFLLDDVDLFYVVVGPGSPTALRASLSIVNTIAWVREIPVVAVEQGGDDEDSDTLEELMGGYEQVDMSTYFAEPVYGRGPGVTVSTKDRLRQ